MDTYILHKDLKGTTVHHPIAFVYVNAYDRANDQSLSSNDIKKLAVQEDDNSLWILINNNPIYWKKL